MNICFVCTGNICRSPVAEYIMKRESGKIHNVISAGTLGIYGEPAYIECINLGKNYNINLKEHRSQGLGLDIIKKNDLIICLERYHKTSVENLMFFYRLNDFSKIKLLSDYLPKGESFNLGSKGIVKNGSDIPDPMGESSEVVKPVLDVIEKAIQNLVKSLEKT